MFCQKTRSWKGYQNLQYLIVFGDSYSDVGYSPDMSYPDETEPLGIPFPGETYANGPNWVGHLVTSYNQSQLLVFNYASGGEQTQHLNYHLEYQFLPQLAGQPEFAPWDEDDSLFITWIGINDVGSNLGGFVSDGLNIESAITRIFELQKKLYNTGARNFMLIDMPPVHRTPQVLDFGESDEFEPDYENWNIALNSALMQFASSHPDATTFIFSSWDTFTRILDDPTGHGFKTGDPTMSGGGIWLDGLHPTSAVHKILAEDIAKFLESQDPTI